jgi:hypothetical protein
MSTHHPLEKLFVQQNLARRLTQPQIDAYNHGCNFTHRMMITETFVGAVWQLRQGVPHVISKLYFHTFKLDDEGLKVQVATDFGQDLVITHEPSELEVTDDVAIFAHVPYFCDVSRKPIGRQGVWATTLPVVFRCQGHPRYMREGETTFTSLTELDRILQKV